MGLFRWGYFTLKNGRLYDQGDGYEVNRDWPSFSSVEEAEAFLEANDIRATVVKES